MSLMCEVENSKELQGWAGRRGRGHGPRSDAMGGVGEVTLR